MTKKALASSEDLQQTSGTVDLMCLDKHKMNKTLFFIHYFSSYDQTYFNKLADLFSFMDQTNLNKNDKLFSKC